MEVPLPLVSCGSFSLSFRVEFACLTISLLPFQAAARALMDSSDLDAEAVARKAMNIAADMCIYTNKEFLVETMETKEKEEEV